MRRSRSILVLGFLVTAITVTAVASFMVFITVFKKRAVAEPDFSGAGVLVSQASEIESTELLDHHRSHSKPGSFYEAVDVLDVGRARISLSGEQSHTHYVDEGPPVVVGKIVSYLWFDNTTHEVLGTERDANVTFPVGDHVVGLTVVDNTRDTHTSYTSVVVKDSNFPGVYCYYYNSAGIAGFNNDIKQGSRPVAASPNDTISFNSMADFPREVQTRFSNSTFLARIVFKLELANSTKLTFDFAGGLRLTRNGVPLAASAPGVFNLNGSKKPEDSIFQLIYTSPGRGRAKLVYRSGLGPIATTNETLSYNFAKVLPVIASVEPDASTRKGGGRVNILGTSLNTAKSVYFGSVLTTIESIADDGSSLTVTVPSQEDNAIPREPEITVRNDNGASNGYVFLYDDAEGAVPIIFDRVEIKMPGVDRTQLFDRLSGIKYGPDHRLYATSLSSHVIAFELDDDYALVKDSICRSESLGQNRKLMGLAFNYANTNVRLYVASSVLYWKKDNSLSGPKAWQNGIIHVLEKGNRAAGKCLEVKGKVITGLPVSNHDHGINGLVFDDDGKLHIQVGGFTNAGVKRENLGGIDENPLSGASLIADVDAEVFMSGFRNSFGINIAMNGQLYATDNGPSMGYGDKSTTCGAAVPFKKEDERYNVDKLHLVTKDAYGGHPNRNRGRDKEWECKFHSTIAGKEADSKYQPPIAVLKSSTCGVVEYVANSFRGQMKHNLVLTMFASKNSEGTTWRVALEGEKGESVKGKPEEVIKMSGLAVELMPHGGLIMTRVHRGSVVAFKPRASSSSRMSLINVMPNRGPMFGGNIVKITGLNIGEQPQAYFGKPPPADGSKAPNQCTKVTIIKKGFSFYCTVPKHPTPNERVIVYLASRDAGSRLQIYPKGNLKKLQEHGFDYKFLAPRKAK